MHKLTKLREEKGMTTQQLADAAQTTRVTIWRYERGQRKPDAITACKIASALGCTVEELMTED